MRIQNVIRKCCAGVVRKYRNATATVNPRPVIIVGNQKSGTSAIAALLALATGRSLTLDFHVVPPGLMKRIYDGEAHFSELVQALRYDFSRDIIKEPALTFICSACQAAFPNAQFVFVIRHPVQNIRSILDRMGLPGHLKELTEVQLSKVPVRWRTKVSGADIGVNGHYVEVLARRWNVAVDAYLKTPSTFELVRYEEFVADKCRFISNLSQALGFSVSHDIARDVDRPFQPAGRSRDVLAKEFFGEDNLARIKAICGDRMCQVGYDSDKDQ